MSDPLHGHLVDILSDPASRYLILAGGYGILLKLRYVRDAGVRILVADLPDPRATQDLDFFVRLEVFVQKEEGRAVRSLLDRLGYAEATPQWQFEKHLGEGFPEERKVIVDLLARVPEGELAGRIKVKEPRVGTGAEINLHGHLTPEAFAVEDSPLELTLSTDGPSAFVPHPFPWIVMKTVAAWDWLQWKLNPEEARRERSGKHVLDVFLIVGMITESELAECAGFNKRYADHPRLVEARQYAQELYSKSESPGFLEAMRLAGRELDHPTFWEAYSAILGLE